ncbi:MAG: peptide chain release factor N(5)-glutamine methyltransferase [Gammaproteobacteria bacterium]|nr:MAG: peptide chain release factor N(5)-glutamine methyltransferase [Gammaproteobacteria bacterium]
MSTVKQALENARARLQDRVDSSSLDSQILLADTLGVDRAWLYAHADELLEPTAMAKFENAIQRREAGEPVAYITGVREFWSLPFKVTPATLIPRPETEHLVEFILDLRHLPQQPRVLDFGTGSGAIAIALAHEKPTWKITAVDISEQALAVAEQNALLNKVKTIRFLSGDGFSPVSNERFDIIASNPPYVPEKDPHLGQGDVRYEPSQALVSGPDGLDCIRYLGKHAKDYLVDHGCLILEHGYDQGQAVRALFDEYGYSDITTTCDLNQQERLTSAYWNNRNG